MQICSACGELAVEENVNNCHEKVCTACGVVIDDATFDSECYRAFTAPQSSLYNSRSLHANRAAARIVNKSKPPAALTLGLERLHSLCEATNTTKWESEVAEVLKAVYKTKHFKKKEDVAALAGSILYFMCKTKYQKPILLADVIQHLQCTKRNISTHLNLYKSWLCKNEINMLAEESTQSQNVGGINDCNPPKLAECLIAAVCKNALDEEKQQLIEKTTDAVKLAYSCWLGTGRSTHSIVVACAYVAWKSLDPCNRKRASFPTFCSELGIQDPNARKRATEFEEVLLTLAKKIPLYTETYINHSNLIFYLDFILKNSETLRFDRLEGKFSKEEINCDEYNTFRTLEKRAPREVSKSAVHYDSDMNASDVEIPDAEIDAYINYGVQKKVILDMCEKK